MARIVLGSYMVRYPLGGMMSYVLQYLVGLDRLGHDIWFVETARHPNECFDPVANRMTDDCRVGTLAVDELLTAHGLAGRWSYLDIEGRFHGAERSVIEEVCRTADVFIDMGTHGAWLEAVDQRGTTVLLDGEPGFNQIRMEQTRSAAMNLPEYDRYFTVGMNLGTEHSRAPTAGKTWGHLLHPVVPELFEPTPVPPDAPFTTIMNWQSHSPISFDGVEYGQKDVEFAHFLDLPARVTTPLEVAVAGAAAPVDQLTARGWAVRNAHEVTRSHGSFRRYIEGSAGEFGVCKHIFVALNTGWFSDRSAAYLASGRPVVLQETGFGSHLPTGQGLFAVRTAEEAAGAIETVTRKPSEHSSAARMIAEECLNASVLLARFLDEVAA